MPVNQRARALRNALLLLLCYFCGILINELSDAGLFFFHGFSSLYYLALGICLILYFDTRITDKPLRSILIAIGVFIGIWAFLRAAKYQVFLINDSVGRLCWYLYYIPMLVIPQLYFHAAIVIDKPQHTKIPSVCFITGFITAVFMLLVLTNDRHQMVFTFHPGFINWNTEHSYTYVYWLMIAWHYSFFIISIGMLFVKCRRSASRNLIWIPLSYGIFLVTLLIFYNAGVTKRLLGENIFGFTETSCFLLSGFWIMCISIGFVPSNKGYEKLFRKAGVSAQITDADYRVVYRSDTAMPLTKEQLETDHFILSPNENTLIYKHPVYGGYAYWQADVTELTNLNKSLEDKREALVEESEFLRMENELREKLALVEQKNKVYDLIAEHVLPQSRMIERLSCEAKEDPSRFEENMQLIGIYAVYIKRLSNLMLQAADSDVIERRELRLALEESSRYLTKAGVIAQISADTAESAFSAEDVVNAYERFQKIMELALPSLKAVSAVLMGNMIRLVLEGSCLNAGLLPDFSVLTEDGNTYLSFLIGKEVAQ